MTTTYRLSIRKDATTGLWIIRHAGDTIRTCSSQPDATRWADLIVRTANWATTWRTR